jgi:hypothetical protein
MLEALITEFETTEDPRCGWKVEHRLLDILVIAVCAVLGEAESFEDIALYGRCKEGWLRQFLVLPNGIPSHDTFRRVLALVDPNAFERCFLGWGRAVFRSDEGAPRQVAIDGKTVRRSFDRRKGRSPLHLVSLDALACRPEIAARVVGRGGDCLLTRKGNQRKAHAEVKAWFAANAFAPGAPLRPFFDMYDDGHGRLVRRQVFACPAVGAFGPLADWPDLRAVLAVETIRGVNGKGKVTAEIRHYLSSQRQAPAGGAGRGHLEPLAGRERAALGPRRHLPRGCQPGAGAERGPEPGPAAPDRAQPGPGRHLADGQPEGQAPIRRLGRHFMATLIAG